MIWGFSHIFGNIHIELVLRSYLQDWTLFLNLLGHLERGQQPSLKPVKHSPFLRGEMLSRLNESFIGFLPAIEPYVMLLASSLTYMGTNMYK